MRRKNDALVPLEVAILTTAMNLVARGRAEFHGFQIAKEVKDAEEARLLTAYGTLYKALERMEKQGLLTSRWEDPDDAAIEKRPRRRLYKVTPAGERAMVEALRSAGTMRPTMSTGPIG